MIPSAVYLATPIDRYVRAMSEGDEVLVVGWYFNLSRPIANILRGDQLADDLYCYIMGILHSDWHAVEFLVGDSDYPLAV